jgi:branched-chain amino acid transport system substrate-binding protein
MRIRGVWAASGLVAVLALAACGSSGNATEGTPSRPAAAGQGGSAPTGTTIPIGIISRQTGLSSESYIGSEPAATSWEKWVNAHGGINGHPVKVFFEDSAGDAAKGLSLAKDLVENKHVVAIIPNDPNVDNAIVAYTASQKVPVLSAFPSYPIWHSTPGWFALGIQSVPDGNIAGLTTIKDSGGKSVAAVACAEVAACAAVDSVFKQYAPQVGLRYDGVFKVSASAPSYTAQCLALKDKGTDVLYMGASTGVSVKFMSDCATQDYTPRVLFPYQAFQPAVAKIKGLNALAYEPTVPWYADVPATQDFRSAMKQYGDLSKADETSMFLWSGLEMVRTAAQRAGASVTKDTVMQALFQLKDEDLGGLIAPVSYSEGQGSPLLRCYFVGGYQDGKFTLPQGAEKKCLT